MKKLLLDLLMMVTRPALKCFLFTSLWCLLLLPAHATSYYLSNNGNDLNSGTSPSSPWQTITKLNSVALQPGDSVLFESGGIFRGEITVNNSGNPSQPIFFGKYGAGNLPIISGSQPVSGWTVYSGFIYQAAFTQLPAQLFYNKKQMVIARYPNRSWLFHQAGINNTGFVDVGLTEANDYWNSATVRMRTTERLWESRTVASYANDTVLLSSNTSHTIKNGYGYYFDGLVSLLDTAEEWIFDAANSRLLFNAPANADPSTAVVEASIYSYGIHLLAGSSYITVRNLQFEQQKNSAIFADGYVSGLKIDSSVFTSQNESGIDLYHGSDGAMISSNTLRGINGISIRISAAASDTLQHNTINACGLIAGYGIVSNQNPAAIEISNSSYCSITANTLDSIGSMGMFISAAHCDCRKNMLSNCLLQLSNLGCIHLYGPQADSCTLTDNFIFTAKGNIAAAPYGISSVAGVYLDQSSANQITHNTMAYLDDGIHLYGAGTANAIEDNVCYGSRECQLKITEGSTQGSNSGHTITGNIFYSLSETAEPFEFVSGFHDFSPATSDSNYYFNPYDYHIGTASLAPSGSSFPVYYNLNQWQQHSVNDAHSHETFFHASRYQTTDSATANLVGNSFFTNNYDGWESNNPDTLQLLLDNSTPLDFGCIRLSYLYNLPDSNNFIYTDDLVIDSGSIYQFHISTYSRKPGNIVLKTKNYGGGFGFVIPPQPFPSDTVRNDYVMNTPATASCDPCQLSLQLSGHDSLTWLDNITMYQVHANYQAPERISRLFINPTANEVLFDLGDSVFYNLDAQQVTGTLSLPAWSSTVLIFDSSLILSSPEVHNETAMQLYPNPARAGSNLQISLPSLSGSTTIILSNMQGIKFLEQKVKPGTTTLSLHLPASISPGMYFIHVSGNRSASSRKLIIQ